MDFIIGVNDFGEVMQKGFGFVDKSLFIKEILDNASTKVTIITRPRRFGKTLNMSMLHHFLASEVKGVQTKGMFDHLKIAQCGSAYMEHQGKYPVIFISFESVVGNSFADAYEQLRTLLQQLYQEHRYLMTSEKLHPYQKKSYEAILNREIDNTVAGQVTLEHSLAELAGLLRQHHGVRPWVLIDAHDTPIHSACCHGYYDEMMRFMQGMLSSVLKGNSDVHRGVVTGIVHISGENSFAGLNNICVYSILDKRYTEHFGFTEFEVHEVFKKAGLETSWGLIRSWYNGYHIGEHQLYNPGSILSCVHKQGVVQPYWPNTSSDDLIKIFMAVASTFKKEQFARMLQGESIEQAIDKHRVFGRLKTADAIWNLLLFSGYLTVAEQTQVDTHIRCLLRIPNQEVTALYEDMK